MADEYRRMRQLTGTPAEWASSGLIIGDAEIAVERTGNKSRIKLGDGFSTFIQLPYLDVGNAGGGNVDLNHLSRGDGAGGLINSSIIDDGTEILIANPLDVANNASISGTLTVAGVAAFTSPITIPTAAPGTSNTTAANTAFVNAAIVSNNEDFVNKSGDVMTGKLTIANGGLEVQNGGIIVQSGGLNITGNSQFISPVTGPTAAPGTSNTQLATTAFVQNAVSGGGVYVRKDGDTMTGALIVNHLDGITTQKLTVDDVVISGVATAPTPALGTNDDTLATTAFVLANAGAGFPEAPTDGQIYGRRGSDATWQVASAGSTPNAQRKEIVATAGQTDFNFDAPYAVGYVSVYINGARQSIQDFTATGGTLVTLDNPVLAGDIVLLDSFTEAALVGIGEAPTDGKQYSRKDAAWSEIVAAGLPSSTMAQFNAACSDGDFVFMNGGAGFNNLAVNGPTTLTGGTVIDGGTASVSILAPTASLNLGQTQTTGLINLGSSNGTGTITLGISTDTQIVNLATGAVASGKAKTVNIGTGGLAGSTTAINLGSTNGSTTAVTGTFTQANGQFTVTTGANAVSIGSTSSVCNFGSTQTTGAINMGGTSGTGDINIGRSTSSQTFNLGNGATGSGNTKTINFGTGGVSGSTTNITYGSSFGTTHLFNGTRLRADFTTTPLGNRLWFQTSTVNGDTYVGAMPNGTGIISGFSALSSSDTTNFAYCNMTIAPNGAALITGNQGTGVAVPLLLGTSNIEQARIDTFGHFYFGVTTVGGLWNGTNATNGTAIQYRSAIANQVNDQPNIFLTKPAGFTSGEIARFVVNNTIVGNIATNGTTTAFNTTSDIRLKKNIVDAATETGLIIDAIRIVEFDWKGSGEHQRFGSIAQELNDVYPESVSKPMDGDEDAVWGVDYSHMVPLLIKEIQSLRARVAELEAGQ